MHPFLIHRPIGVLTVLSAVLALGLGTMKRLPVSLLPDMNLPQIIIQISDPTASARQLNENMAEPLRLQLIQLSQPVDIRSDIREGSGTMVLTADYGTDMDFLFIEVNEKIDRAMNGFPAGTERPRVIRSSLSDIPAFYLNISGKTNGAANDFLQVSQFVRQFAVRRIEQLSEVAMVDFSGLAAPEIRVTLRKERLDPLHLQAADIENAIRSADLNLGSLQLKDSGLQYSIRLDNRLLDTKDIGDIALLAGRRMIHLRDVADVKEQIRAGSGTILSDGRRAASLAVIKRRDARMHDLHKSIQRLLASFEKDYPDMQFTMTRNQTALLEEAMHSMIQNLVLGTLLACLVIFLFMNELRPPLLVSFTIPVSLVISMLVFHAAGIGINIISLSGLILGIGMLVDNAIIAMDNITRWQRLGTNMTEACVRGTREVFTPMLTSVLTTCVIFIPLVFMNGLSSALFRDQAAAVAITLSAALTVSMTVLPVCAALPSRNKRRTGRRTAPIRQEWLQCMYHAVLKHCLRHRRASVHLLWISAAGTAGLFIMMDKQKMPDITTCDALMEIAWNDNISVEENERRCAALTAAMPATVVTQHTVMAGVQQFILSHSRVNALSDALIYLACDTPESLRMVLDTCSHHLQTHHPEAIVSVQPAGNVFDQLFSENEPLLTLRLRRSDGKEIQPEELEHFRNKLMSRLPEARIQPIEQEEYIDLSADRDMMDRYGISYLALKNAVGKWIRGSHILDIVQGSLSVPVTASLHAGTDTPPLQDAFLSAENTEIPLTSLLSESRRYDWKRLTADHRGTFCSLDIGIRRKSVPEAVRKARQLAAEEQVYQADFSGTYFTGRQTVSAFTGILLTAVLLLYLILAAQFESLLQPVIILSELVIDLFFSLLTLHLCGESLNAMSMTGLVVMSGIVINDSILKIDTINTLRRSGMEMKKAIFIAGNRRLNAIIMTSLTTILTIVPSLFGHSMGNDLQRPLSITLISGMCIGTLVSMFYIPVLYYTIHPSERHAD